MLDDSEVHHWIPSFYLQMILWRKRHILIVLQLIKSGMVNIRGEREEEDFYCTNFYFIKLTIFWLRNSYLNRVANTLLWVVGTLFKFVGFFGIGGLIFFSFSKLFISLFLSDENSLQFISCKFISSLLSSIKILLVRLVAVVDDSKCLKKVLTNIL